MALIYSCVAFGHNLWLVAAAAGVCGFGCWVVLGLFGRALQSSGAQRLGWQGLAAICAGSSIWCTHFVAILAYDPGAPVGFDLLLTIASGLVAALGAAIAFVIALAGAARAFAAIGGALLGLSISGMHYCGMLAYRVEGLAQWSIPVLVLSIAIAVVFGAASLHVAVHGAGARRALLAKFFLLCAIVGLHFTGMAALHITPLALRLTETNSSAFGVLALAIVVITLLIVGTGAASYLIDENVRADAFGRLRSMALQDGLTGLPNRVDFRERLAGRIAEAGSVGKVSLVMIDLNGFKEVNDQFGHGAGDTVLKWVSDQLKKTLGPNEFAARLGGDEFAVVQASQSDDDVDDLVKRLSGFFAEAIDVADYQGRIGASMGIAVFPGDATDVESLVNNADLAMYRAKAEQSEHVCFYEHAMDERVRARRRMAADLRAAIANGEIEVHYQVQTAVDGGGVQGFEALARWPRAEGGFTPPSDFIPIAEEYGLIDTLGHMVLRRACMDAALWEPPYKVAVNLSPAQLTRPGLPLSVAAVLQETGLAPSRLELELTESGIIRDAKASLRAMLQIRQLGVSLALDDFGTGYSSLSTLRTFPFDKIKLDRSFLREIETSQQAKAVLRAVLALGEGLGIPVLTEGVETEGQLEMLRKAGCSQAQGYLLGRPAAISALVAAGRIQLKQSSTVQGETQAAA